MAIAKVKAAMRYAVNNLNPNDSFNIFKFSNTVERLSNSPLTATSDNQREGLRFIEGLRGGGGTEMLSGILEALKYPSDPSKLRIIALMSDGFIGNESQILNAIQRDLGEHTRLFSFGIGSSVNRYLLDSMARLGRGEVTYVTLRDSSDEAIEKFYKRIGSPLLTDLSLNWGGLDVYELYPQKIPDLFAGQPLYIHGKYRSPGTSFIRLGGQTATLEGSARADRQFSFGATLPVEDGKKSWIGRLWARSKIADLSDQMHAGQKQELIKEITDLGLTHRLVTAYTSFVAVEETPATTPGQPARIIVPVELPEGTQYEGFFGSAKTSSSGLVDLGMPYSGGGGIDAGAVYMGEFGLGSNTEIRSPIINISRLLLGFFALITLFFITYSGIRLLRLPTDDVIKRKATRRQLIIGVVILVIIIAVYALIGFIISSILANSV